MTRESPALRLVPRPTLEAVEPVRVGQAALQEALPTRPFDAAATAFVLAALPTSDLPVLWVCDRLVSRDAGRLYRPGMGKPTPGGPILRVDARRVQDALWAMEEGASCAGLAAVVGEIHGAPTALDFTATKRLALRAEATGVPVWLIRSGDPGTLSAARERWRVTAAPSGAHPWDARAPGPPQWEVELFRARGRAPDRWVASYDPDRGPADRLHLAAPTGDGSVAPAPAWRRFA